jgi:DNA (cytosine-5)-methyltransferase 1
MMTFGSLFAGIGGFDLGLERAGMECTWQVEIDPFCQKVLAKHWPEVKRYGDIRECGAHNLESVDLICGGFPCQDISTAGKRVGINAPRSGLWSEYHRIICELRPAFIIVENVAALLERGMGRVLGDLAQSGYDAEWQVLSAAALGAPHLRERVFICAYPNRNRLEKNPHKETLCNASIYGRVLRRFSEMEFKKQWVGPRPIGARPLGMDDGISSDVDRLKSLGNSVVPQLVEIIGRAIVDTEI